MSDRTEPRNKTTLLHRWLVLVVVLQATFIGFLITGGGDAGPALLQEARAQVPDSGAQRLQIIDELKQLNRRVDVLQATLEGGIKVKVEKADEKER